MSTAYAVSGSCESLMDILPDSIHVCGRIPPSQVRMLKIASSFFSRI